MPTSPDFKPTPAPDACNTTALINFIKLEFGNASDQAKLANDLKNYGEKTSQATYAGYLLLDAIADKYATPANQAGDRTNASNAGIAILRCIQIGGATIPTTLVPELGSLGAMAVRGFRPSDSRPVFSHSGAWTMQTETTWQDITTLATSGLHDTVKTLFLAIGHPGAIDGFSNDDLVGAVKVFDWATLPEATFTGAGVVVGECQSDANYIQHRALNNGPEVLAFVTPDCSNPLFSMEREPRNFAERIWSMISPTPAYAAFFLTGTAGRGSKLSPFGLISPDVVRLDPLFIWSKSGNKVGVPFNPTPRYQILSEGGTPFHQPGVLVWLEAIGNSGTFVDICFNWDFTDADGKAEFNSATLNKAGGYTIRARTTGTLSVSGIPVVPPGESVPSPLVNIKNGTVPGGNCPTFHEGDPFPAQ